MLILVDSREQLPYWKGSQCARTALLVGDYTTAKLLNLFHIERKSMADLYGTIIQGHSRFRREILRSYENKTTLVVYVEGSKKDFVAKKFPRGQDRKIESKTLEKICNSIALRYNLEIVWCKDREDCRVKVLKRLKVEERKV